MCLGEKILDFPAGLDIPVRYTERAHLLFCVSRERSGFLYLSLSDRFHRLEGQRRLHADRNQIEHDIVTAADCFINAGDSVYDQIMDVSCPDIGPVREAGKPDQCIELLWLCIHQHLAGKASAEFRHSNGPGLSDDRIILRKTQRSRTCEDAHRLFIGK